MENKDDKYLLQLIKKGNDSAYEDIVKKYERPIYQYCYRFFGSEEDALDSTQEIFIKVYRYIGKFEGKSSLKTWIYRIASNTCITIAQHKKKEKAGLFQSFLNWWVREDNVDTPEEILISNETREITQSIVSEKIASLKEVYRGPVIMKDIKGMTLEEIAEILQIPKGTVKSRINRGRRILQEKLRSYYVEGI